MNPCRVHIQVIAGVPYRRNIDWKPFPDGIKIAYPRWVGEYLCLPYIKVLDRDGYYAVERTDRGIYSTITSWSVDVPKGPLGLLTCKDPTPIEIEPGPCIAAGLMVILSVALCTLLYPLHRAHKWAEKWNDDAIADGDVIANNLRNRG
jgi:hypothetical protein